ncbi:hypothetical protein [Daejeonella lutea]|uniref:Uncharacterized protein n=1 Tax=Daejeonella lutea TaxID=572036 RepID=A0A1T5DR99_9SPHI|nr:hypothetical protein [Daejeonella lutea]SKB74194.1 hypothetical protein SAMN05661099_2535 [Daejeonella lutea]
MGKFLLTAFLLIASATIQAQVQKNNVSKKTVLIKINIEANGQFSGDVSNLSFLQNKLLEELRTVPKVSFVIASANEKPEAVIGIKVSNFFLSQRDEKTTVRTVTTDVEIGKDASNNPIKQNVAANIQNTVVKRNSRANLETIIAIDGDIPFNYQKVFPSQYNYVNSTTAVSGDLRAIGNGLRIKPPGSGPPEPLENEFLYLLAKKDLMGRVIEEIKKYYQTQTKTAKVK